MSLNKKLIFLVFIFVILIIYTILSFDYTKVSSDNKSEIKQINDVIKIKNKDKAISLEILKDNNLVTINGEFKNRVQLKYLLEYLNINKEEKISFDNMVVFKQENIDEIKELISPLKDYFENDSKIILKDKKIFIEGKLKNKKFYNLILAILDKSKVKINQKIDLKEIVLPEIVETPILKEIEIVPKESLQSKINKLVKETKVTFKRKSSKPTEKTFILLKEIAQLIKNEKENIKIELAGHTDARGPSALNKRLSLFRAEIIKKELVKLGVNASMLTAVGYGEKYLIKKGNQHYSKLNRRVEFNVSILTQKEALIIGLQNEINDVLKNNKIEFKRRSTEVTQESLKALKEIALLIINNDIKIEIAGHTDAKGKASLNKRISEQRANGVKEQLIKLGVNSKLLTAVGYGESKPIVKNDKNGLSKINRRVEFYIMEKK